MRKNKDNEWKPSIRKMGGNYYIDIVDLMAFFGVRGEMKGQELDEWLSKNDLDEPGVVEVAAEIDGAMEELDYLIKVLSYLRNSHVLSQVKTVDDLEKFFPKSLDKREEL